MAIIRKVAGEMEFSSIIGFLIDTRPLDSILFMIITLPGESGGLNEFVKRRAVQCSPHH